MSRIPRLPAPPLTYNGRVRQAIEQEIRPKVLSSVLFPKTFPNKVAQQQGIEQMYGMDRMEAPFRDPLDTSLRDQLDPDMSRYDRIKPPNLKGNTTEAKESYESYLSKLQNDPQALRERAEAAANNLILQQLGIVSGIGAGVGGVGLVANHLQEDSNGNLLVNPVTTGALTTLGAGLGAGMIGRESVKDDPRFYKRLPDINDKSKNAQREYKVNRHNEKLAARRNQRGLRAGATTAGAVALLNLIGALRDEQ